MERPKLYVMCGISGSGKSTWAVEHAEELDAYIISTDGIRGELWGDENDQRDPRKVFATAFHRIDTCLQKGWNVIFDATNLSARDRRKVICYFKTYAEMVCVNMYCDPEIAIERQSLRDRKVPEEVIRRQMHKYTVPSYDEGWDQILFGSRL